MPLDALFHALSNDTRREIISLLAERPHNISELVPRFDMSLAAVSKHVKTLERAGLIDRQVVGRNHICRLNAEALGEAYAWIGGYERFWQQRIDTLERVLKETQGGSHGGRKK
ncbi:metalloregulator ArsR/SmtB family transcription factor [Hyphomicrobium sp. CS1GBMeth3]|uniref:ArsR/SmtB family transcription factor n=1 Tax=Hyphomicrobium sp. CS1GBMeth3 TaxID=1892845 RepID=UPI000ADE7B2F|nr:metalloregulator ArsR/SmtB family transcription factor [Hyphomicrobium sp. CS1GBMeth3]